MTVEFQAKDPQMTAYLKYVQVLKGVFATFELVHVPREQNARADLLAKLASSGKGEGRGQSFKKRSKHRENLWRTIRWTFFKLAQQEESQGAIAL